MPKKHKTKIETKPKAKGKTIKLARNTKYQTIAAIVIIVAAAILGYFLFIASHAASPFASTEAETGTRTGSATIVSNTTAGASGNSYVQFGSPPSTTCTSNCSGLYAVDTFQRTISNGWGTADTGGAWTQAKGSASDVSVNGSSGVFVIPGAVYTSSDQVMVLNSTSELNYTGTFEVSFMDNLSTWGGTCGGVNAYLVARYQNTGPIGYYRMGISWGGTELDMRTQNPTGATLGPQDFTVENNSTGIYPTTDYPNGPPYSYMVKVTISGSNPTTFNSKVWKVGKPEPANWMNPGTDSMNFGPQVAAPIGFRAVNDLNDCSSTYTHTAHIQINNISVGP